MTHLHQNAPTEHPQYQINRIQGKYGGKKEENSNNSRIHTAQNLRPTAPPPPPEYSRGEAVPMGHYKSDMFSDKMINESSRVDIKLVIVTTTTKMM